MNNEFIKYLQDNYKYKAFCLAPNKNKLPANIFTITDQLEEFNRIYYWARDNLLEVKPEKSGSMPYSSNVKYNSRYMIVVTRTGFELVICSIHGMWRFILNNGHFEAPAETITGRTALRELFKAAKTFGVIEEFQKLAVTKDEGKQFKEQIEPPMITACEKEYLGKEFINCHHLDLNSSYASRISEKYPALRPMYEYLYAKRKARDGYYKSVLANSIGAMQSQYCIDCNNTAGFVKAAPYQLAKLSMEAINGNNEKIRELLFELEISGRKPILINTDGIWYQGEIYRNRDCGDKLGQWKNDHVNCRLYVKSNGAYQYMENNKVKSVVRGYTRLDMVKPREDWGWREIDNYDEISTYKFDRERGVYEIWQKI